MTMNTKEQWKHKYKNKMASLRETRNSIMDEQSEEPQHLDYSKSVRRHNAFSWSNEFLVSSNKWWFCSLHTFHIKQPKTMFQISDPCFLHQSLQQNNKLATKPGITQLIPNVWSISTHKAWTTSQWSRRWCTDSHYIDRYNTNLLIDSTIHRLVAVFF